MDQKISKRPATPFKPSHLLPLLGPIFILAGCGKPVVEDSLPAPDEGIPVGGVAGFGSQCPYGFIEDPFPAKLELWNCPIGLNKVDLLEPLRPIYFQVDCKKKTVNVRKPNRTMDTAWEIMPDGTFFMTIDGGIAKLSSDGPGHGKCNTPLSADLMGRIDCTDRDKIEIQLESVFWLGKKEENPNPRNTGVPGTPLTPEPPGGDSPANSPANPSTASEMDNAPECRIPPSCYFYTKAKIKQCS